MATRNNWSEAETILAFFYYCQIPFGKIHKENKEIQRIAALIGRTPSSVVFKMGNLGHFDPELQKRNVSGLKNASKLDGVVVEKQRSQLRQSGKRCDVGDLIPAEVQRIQPSQY